MSENIEDRHTILSETSGGKLTPQDVYNLETYGALSPKEFAPDPSEEPKRDIAYVVQKIVLHEYLLYKWVLIMSKEKLDKLYDEKWELESVAVRKVNDETKVIKYDNIPQEIYIKVMGIAEDNNIDASDSSDLEWKIKEVREKVNELESAIYDLVEPSSRTHSEIKTMRLTT